jgi:hypothetical protein
MCLSHLEDETSLPIIVDQTTLYLEKNATKNREKTKQGYDLACSVMQVVEVQSQMQELHDQRHAKYCENSNGATQYDVGNKPPTPPVNKIASSPYLRDT